MKNIVIQSEEFNMKENRCYNVPVLINLHQDIQKMLSSGVRSSMTLMKSKTMEVIVYKEKQEALTL